MTNDGLNTNVYDAENRSVSASNGSSAGAYVYDGNGMRVKKCVTNCTSPTTSTVYIFSGSKVIAEYDNNAVVASPSREYIYAGAALLAKIDSAGTKFYHQDLLSNRLVTDSSGNIAAQLGHYPFGETWYNSISDKLLFTSYERDSESTNDYAMARYYLNRLSRFSSPDPLSGSSGDPQSLTRYSYVENGPPSWSDVSGLNRAYQGCSNCPGSTFGPGGGLGLGDGSIWSAPLSGSLVATYGSPVWASFQSWGVFNSNGISYYAMGFEGNVEDEFYPFLGYQYFGADAASGGIAGSGSAGNNGTSQTPQKTPCAVQDGKHLSMGVSLSAATVNPGTSRGGGVWGVNQQSFGASTYNYTYSGTGAGLDVGASIQSSWAWGSGGWAGPFKSINFPAGPFAGSIYWSPGKGGWTGASFGLGVGSPGVSYQVTNYTCKSGPG